MLLKYYDNAAPASFLLETLSDNLLDGKIIIIPTDTVYSICCDALNQQSIEDLAKLKGVDSKKTRFSILCSDLSQASEYARISNEAFKLIKDNTPGPFTFILPTISTLPKIYRGRKEVGIRIPRHELVQSLVRFYGRPLTGFSLPALSPELDEAYGFDPSLIHELYQDLVSVVVDGGRGGERVSAIVDCTAEPFEVVREGPEELMEA
ncbi:MAG: threonylcarbamoyl-AMP synthase [Bacteroidales bacterium]|nr:threonylcarbamoyl-AMP synthase [Bacteroidales bacterium]